MKKTISVLIILTIIFLALISCSGGEIGTGVSNPPTNTTTKTASAVAAIFGSEENASINEFVKIPAQLLDLMVKKALAQEEFSCGESDPACTCFFVSSGEDSPTDINTTTFDDDISAATSGTITYGSADNSITLNQNDYCQQPDGTDNTGTGPDGNGLFAAFELIGDVMGTCTNSDVTTLTMKAESEGIFRETQAFSPQIYGSFIFEVDGETVEVDCTIFLVEDGSVNSADCSDENGDTVLQDTDSSCSFSDN